MIRGLPMRLTFLRALPLALLACAAAYLAIVGRPAPAEVPVESPPTVGAIDFDILHRQASTALEALRHSHEHQRKLATAEAS